MEEKYINTKRLPPAEYNGVPDIDEKFIEEVEKERVPEKRGSLIVKKPKK